MELIDKILDWGDEHWKLVAVIGFIAVCILNHQEKDMSKIKSHYWEELTEQEEESETKKKCKK